MGDSEPSKGTKGDVGDARIRDDDEAVVVPDDSHQQVPVKLTSKTESQLEQEDDQTKLREEEQGEEGRTSSDTVRSQAKSSSTPSCITLSHTAMAMRQVCQMCRDKPSCYCCPRCQMRTCSLACVVRHKEDSGCSGLRDRAKFVSKAEFTDLDLLSDYRMLEEVNRGLENAAREGERESLSETSKERRWHLPPSMLNLRMACRKPARSCRLLFMPKGFERRRENNSRFDFRTRSIVWRVRMVFPHCKRTVLLEEVDESTKVFRLFQEYVEPDKMKSEEKFKRGDDDGDLLADDPFALYRANWPGGIMALLKAEHLSEREARGMQEGDGDTKTKRVARFFELDLMRSLRANLRGRTVVEHPVIFVVLKSHADYFPANIELPNTPEVGSKGEQKGTNDVDANSDKNNYQHNWDWSDYQNSTVSGKRGLQREHEEEEDDYDEHTAGKTFGLFAENDSDLSEGEEWGEESRAERVKRRLDEEEDERRDLKRQRSRETCQRILDGRRRAWRGVQARHEDASLVHAFAMQGEDQGGAREEPEADGLHQQAPTDEDYGKYYDFYLKYYQNQYGVSTAPSTDKRNEGDPEPTPRQKSPDISAKVSNLAGSLVGYDESDDDE